MLYWLQRCLWAIAVVALVFFAGTVVERWVSQAYLDWEFTRALELPARAELPLKSDGKLLYDASQPLGRIEIPSIKLSALFVEGDDAATLRRGVGHIPGTALPGAAGNVALSAHRDTFFRRLGELGRGDVIWITTLSGRYQYVVESSQLVNPDQRAVLRDLGRPTLTLVTCYPFYYVGPAPKRFVLHAGRVER